MPNHTLIITAAAIQAESAVNLLRLAADCSPSPEKTQAAISAAEKVEAAIMPLLSDIRTGNK